MIKFFFCFKNTWYFYIRSSFRVTDFGLLIQLCNSCFFLYYRMSDLNQMNYLFMERKGKELYVSV